MTSEATSSFFKFKVFGHNPFEYNGDVFRMNPTVTTADNVFGNISTVEKYFLSTEQLRFFSLNVNLKKPVIVGIIDRVFDDPFMGGVKAEVPEAENKAKEINDMLVDMNGVDFHRQMYQYMIKPMFERMVALMTDGKTPDELSVGDFLYLFTINFFAKSLIGNEKSSSDNRVKFFEKVYEDPNAFDYVFLGKKLPAERDYMYFLVWEK